MPPTRQFGSRSSRYTTPVTRVPSPSRDASRNAPASRRPPRPRRPSSTTISSHRGRATTSRGATARRRQRASSRLNTGVVLGVQDVVHVPEDVGDVLRRVPQLARVLLPPAVLVSLPGDPVVGRIQRDAVVPVCPE